MPPEPTASGNRQSSHVVILNKLPKRLTAHHPKWVSSNRRTPHHLPDPCKGLPELLGPQHVHDHQQVLRHSLTTSLTWSIQRSTKWPEAQICHWLREISWAMHQVIDVDLEWFSCQSVRHWRECQWVFKSMSKKHILLPPACRHQRNSSEVIPSPHFRSSSQVRTNHPLPRNKQELTLPTIAQELILSKLKSLSLKPSQSQIPGGQDDVQVQPEQNRNSVTPPQWTLN